MTDYETTKRAAMIAEAERRAEAEGCCKRCGWTLGDTCTAKVCSYVGPPEHASGGSLRASVAALPRDCAGCRHWGNEKDTPDSPMSLHLDMDRDDYGSPAPVAPHRKCLKLVHLQESSASALDVTRPAYLMDASRYHAALWTRPDFGCSAFEQRSME